MKLAILLTCFNRKEKTIKCVEQLLAQLECSDYEYRFYVCDDRSTDGTYEGLKKLLPTHAVFQSDGNFYWSKGMYTVMKMAVAEGYDYYLMVNDDVDFFEDALESMFTSYERAGQGCGIVGTTKSSDLAKYTYGGRDREQKLVAPEAADRQCVWTNWNCFLIDKLVVDKVGVIDGKYQHAWGDYDYSYRMQKANCKIFVAEKTVGICDLNPTKGSYKDNEIKRSERLKKLCSPKGQPFYSFMRYHLKTKGKMGVLGYLYGYMSLIVYILLGRKIG